MATRRYSAARKPFRRNPRRGSAILVNPRKKRTTKTRRRTNTRKRKATKRPAAKRVNRSHARKTTKRRVNRSKHKTTRKTKSRRQAPKYVTRRKTNGRKRKMNKRRRVNSASKSVMSMLKKIPFVGSYLASMAGFIGPAAFGALGVYPTTALAKVAAPYFPMLDSKLFYVIAGLAMATIINMPFIPLPKKIKEQLSIGIASGAGAIAVYKMARNENNDLSGEYGALAIETNLSGYGDYQILPGYGDYEILPGYGDFQYAIIPGYGNTLSEEAASLNSPDLGALAIQYNDASMADAASCGADMSYGEAHSMMAGPRAFRSSYPASSSVGGGSRGPGQSAHAGKEGHRWGWLIKMIGFQKAAQLACLPPAQRQQAISAMKDAALKQAGKYLSADQDLSGYGALAIMTGSTF